MKLHVDHWHDAGAAHDDEHARSKDAKPRAPDTRTGTATGQQRTSDARASHGRSSAMPVTMQYPTRGAVPEELEHVDGDASGGDGHDGHQVHRHPPRRAVEAVVHHRNRGAAWEAFAHATPSLPPP